MFTHICYDRMIRQMRAEQDQCGGAFANGPLDGAAHGGGKRDEDDLVAFAVHAEAPVAVLFAEVLDVAAGGLEDPKAEES